MNRLSACLITFNEEHNLPRVLGSLQGIADEIMVVDCGSKDRTQEIAQERGAKVITHAWTNFAEQKNIAAAAASSAQADARGHRLQSESVMQTDQSSARLCFRL